MAIAPIPKNPGARGGQALPVIKTTTPKIPTPNSPGWKAFTAARWHANNPPKAPTPHVTTPVEEAMSAYRQAVAALGTAVAPVDTAAIHAPYAQAEQTTGQLGQGYGQMLQQSGDAASNQFTTAQNAAQQAAAQFGISAGAGANPTQLQNNGAAPIAAQTQANTASAAAATNQWQRLLEQASAGKVADATTARQGALDTARAGLAANIPTLIGNEKDRAFQKQSEKDNMGLAYSQLTDKERQFAQQYGLDTAKYNAAVAHDAATTATAQSSLAERTRHDHATEKGAAIRAKRAAASGAKGMPQVIAALKIATPTGSATTKAAKGFDVQVQPWDAANDKPSGPAVTKHLPRLDVTLPGYKVLTNTATTHWETVPSKTTKSSGMTLAQWNKAVGIYARYNGVSPTVAAQAVQAITPKPPK